MKYRASRASIRSLSGWVCAVAVCVGARTQAAIVGPTDVAGCVLWLDASDTETITLTDGRVSAWRDKSGGGAHQTQGDAARRPVTGQALLNGRNALTFDGSRWLAGPAVLQPGDDAFSYFAVWQRVDAGTAAQTVFEQSQTPQVTGTRAALLTVGSAKQYGFNGQGNDAHNLGSYTPGAWVLTGLELDGRASRNVFLYSDSTNHVGAINMTTQYTGATGTRVGCKLTNSGEILNGLIAEIIVFDRVLSDTDRNAVLFYLQEKWGLERGFQDYALLIDFEHDRLPEGWITNGAAFATQPVNSTRVAFGPRGEWFVGTHENTKTAGTAIQGDAPTGTLAGVAFILSNNTVRARVAGGSRFNAGSELQVQLERETGPDVWQVARKASGWNGETMRESRWNVRNLIGERVRFRVVDLFDGTWGQLIADDIRVLDEPMPRALRADFSGTALPAELIVQRPYQSPDVALTGTGTVRMALLNGTHDIWSATDRGPKVLLNTVDDDTFTLETHLVCRSYTNSSNMAGLILMFEEPDANTFDPVMFGVHRDGVIVQGPSVTATNALPGVVTNIRLRVRGRGDRFTYEYSVDGETWPAIRSDTLPGKVLLHAGLFCKDWSLPSALEVEFDYLNYTAAPIPRGTLISVL